MSVEGITGKQALCEYFSKSPKLDPTHLLSLLDAIEAPECLSEFGTIAKNLAYIFPYVTKIAPDLFEDVPEWINICSTIDSEKETISSVINDFYLPGRKYAKKGYIVSNPFYYCFWFNTKDPTTTKFIYYLQAHVLVAVNRFKPFEKGHKIEGYIDARRNISLLLRRHLTEKVLPEFQLQFPQHIQTTEALHNHLSDITKTKSKSKSKQIIVSAINKVHRLLDFALQKSAEKEKQHSQISQFQRLSNNTYNFYKSDADAEYHSHSTMTVQFQTVNDTQKDSLISVGEAPDELLQDNVAIWSSEKIQSLKGESYKLRMHNNSTKYRYIATANQKLSHDFGRLNFYDITFLMILCHKLSQSSLPEKTLSESRQKQLAALITIMYWLSKDITDASNTKIITQDYVLRLLNPDVLYMQAGNTTKIWHVPLPALHSCRKAKSNEEVYVQKTTDRIQLPIPDLALQLLQPWISHHKSSIKKRDNLFTRDLEHDLRYVLKVYNKKLNTRLTIHRISHHFRQYLAEEIGDDTESAICLGEYPTAGEQSAIYYAAPQVSVLQQNYFNACNYLEGYIKRIYPFESKTSEENNLQITSDEYAGSNICLIDEAVNLLVTDLISKVETHRLRKSIISQSLIHFHNALTAYCIEFLKFATGYRDVKDPLYSLTDYLPQHRLLVISDKDSTQKHMERVVYVPHILGHQIDSYEEHRIGLLPKLHILNPNLATKLQLEATHSHCFNKTEVPPVPFFFFLNEETWKLIPVTPSSLEREIRWCFHLPANANRHFLRSKLRQKNIHGEIIDMFMGHSRHGREPFNKYSSISPLLYKNHISSAIEKIVADSGWQVIKGF